jgi:hypothetical protein
MCLSSECNVTTRMPEASKEGRQVVRSKRSMSYATPQVSETYRQQHRRSLYLKKMKGLYFNCLARDHMVAYYQNSTRCWQFGHTSVKCLSSTSGLPSFSCCSHISEGVPAPPLFARHVDTLVDDNLLLSSPSLAPCEDGGSNVG